MKRTHSCGGLTLEEEGKAVVLSGWALRRRDLGGLIFIDLRDREGITQIVFDSKRDASLHQSAQSLNREYVVSVSGKVVKRSADTENPKLLTGAIEVIAEKLEIINPCTATLPFARLDEEGESALPNEDIRLKYRYIDLRRKKMFDNIKLRHKTVKAIRDFMDREGFLEIETPMMIRTTPEGARDYLVPSRIHPGKFYALPQSPQLFKQLLMVAGFEKYFQIARCMRDEDLRADRQPEFTQLDLEMSFIEREDVLSLIERLFKEVFKKILDVDLTIPFPRISYAESMAKYGTDKPDLRIPLTITDLSTVLSGTSSKILEDGLAKGGVIRAVHLPGASSKFSRKDLDDLSEWARRQGGKGVLFFQWVDGEEKLKSPVAKNLTPKNKQDLEKALTAKPGDLTLAIADKEANVSQLLGKLRIDLANRLQLIAGKKFEFLWVIDFPMFQWNDEENRLDAVHHPFTSPRPEDLNLLDHEPLKVRANAYDVVLNGFEIGSGSIRIHRRDLQEKIFKLMGLSQEEAREKFGFLLDAFQYGAPPHGGIAPGIDRLIMLMAGDESIREVIAFPKNQSAQDLMLDAPVEASEKQLRELSLQVRTLARNPIGKI